MKTTLTIAGSDSSGGAGIQADIKTMMANGVYAMSAVTALTAQNTTGVTSILNATPQFLADELDSIFTDIRPDAVKIGMVSSPELIHVIAQKLTEYHAENVVIDPVMVATSGARLISEDAMGALKEELLPLADLLTPNIPEAQELTGDTITSAEDMVRAAEKIAHTWHCSVLVKGGHNLNDANDLLYFYPFRDAAVGSGEGRDSTKSAQKNENDKFINQSVSSGHGTNGKYCWFHGKRIDNPNTHGTGCTLSSAIASNLAKGFNLETSVQRAKEYISGALAAMLDLGKGSGPMDHGFAIDNSFTRSAASFCETLIQEDLPLWKSFADLPFLRDMVAGTLDKGTFARYLIQDTQYLAAFAKIYAWSFLKTDDLELMQDLYGEMGIIVAGETQSHVHYLEESGVDSQAIMAQDTAPACEAYIHCMTEAAQKGTLAEGIFAAGPCNFSYYYLGLELKERMEAAGTYETNYFREWLDYYISEEYREGCERWQRICERVSENLTQEEQAAIRRLFRRCSEYEREFWIMAYEELPC